MKKTNAKTLVESFESESVLSVVRLLISLEADQVYGSGHRNLLSLANSFDAGEGYRAMTLVVRALERWKPDYFAKPSMVKALKKARDRLDSSRKSQWGQKSAVGLIREALFPEWHLR